MLDSISVWNARLAEAFDRQGVVRLPRAFDASEAERMREVVWRELTRRYGIDRSDPSTWDRHPPTGLKSTKKSCAFWPILGPVLKSALDELFGVGAWSPPKNLGQVLVTMPNADCWRVPHSLWHSDFLPTEPQVPLGGVKVWALFGDVEPGGGGTPQLVGSHRLFAFPRSDRGAGLQASEVRFPRVRSMVPVVDSRRRGPRPQSRVDGGSTGRRRSNARDRVHRPRRRPLRHPPMGLPHDRHERFPSAPAHAKFHRSAKPVSGLVTKDGPPIRVRRLREDVAGGMGGTGAVG